MNDPLRVLILCSGARADAILPESDSRFRCMTVRGAEPSGLWFAGPAPDAIVLADGVNAGACLEPVRLQYPAVPILHLGAANGNAACGSPAGVIAMDGPVPPEVLAERILQLAQARTEAALAGDDETGMLGQSPEIEAVRRAIAKAADADVTVLLRGESGTGKEVAARSLWSRSHRAQFPFIKVNCAAIPCELLESELFGYEAGAFTGAVRQKAGKFELAHRGTIFLDEISEMHPLLQAKLLHVLQDGEFCRLGGRQSCSVDVRVVAATNSDLEAAVAAGRFRRDLFYRLSVVNIHLPPLRQRSEDVELLLEHYCRHYAARFRRPLRRFRPSSLEVLKAYSWPGNVRELENLAKRLVVMGDERQILLDLATLPARLGVEGERLDRRLETPLSHAQAIPYSVPQTAVPQPASFRENGYGAEGSASANSGLSRPEERFISERRRADRQSLLEIGRQAAQRAETEAIMQALQQTRWNRRQAAELLQVSYKALQNKMKCIDLKATPDFSGGVPTAARPQ